MAAVFDRKGIGKGMCSLVPCDNLIALSREVAQVGREGTEDGTVPVFVSHNVGTEVLEGLLEGSGMHPGVPGKIKVAAQEGHDVAMELHFDGGWIKEIPLGAPELGPGEVELVCPVLNAADVGAFKEGGRANANGMPFLGGPRSDSITPVFVVASAS